MTAGRMLFRGYDGPIPDGLDTDEFLLRPIAAADTPLDYAAVMETREVLRSWEQTGWPAEDFTLEEDLADVEGLERRHGERGAFTYTVLTPDESVCLGCVYLLPPDAREFDDAVITATGGAQWHDVRALVYFWVRASRIADGLDARLLAALRDWFTAEWDLEPLLFVTNEQVPQQVALLERTGLRPLFRIAKAGQVGAFLAYV